MGNNAPGYHKAYYQKNRARLLAYQKEYKLTHGKVVMTRANKQRSKTARLLRLEIITALGSRCQHCQIADIRVLQIDHKNGGGSQERKKLGSGVRYYKHLLSSLKNYQLLCANCNWIKRIEQEEAPA